MARESVPLGEGVDGAAAPRHLFRFSEPAPGAGSSRAPGALERRPDSGSAGRRRIDHGSGHSEGDLVQVVSGSDRGKQGRVLAVDPEKRRVRVEKVRVQKRHLKPGRRGARTGGILEQEGFIDLSNVMLVDETAGGPSRIRIEEQDGGRVRVFAKSGEPVPDPTRAQ